MGILPKPITQPDAAHPISVVAARTGLSRDVLRVWERRYGAVEPIRTPGGQRRYSDTHVERFRLLAAAIGHGRTIGLVARLGTEELTRLVAEDEAQFSPQYPDGIPDVAGAMEAAMASIVALDAPALDAQLRRAIAHEGVPWFVEVLVPALMRAVGDRWVAGRLTIAHEHLASASVIAIIMETVRALPPRPAAPRVVVATPSGDQHAMGAALAAAAASLQGWSIVYLGADVPHADIGAAAAVTDARAVALSITYVEDRARILAEVRALRGSLNETVPLLIGGAGMECIAAAVGGRNITLCDSLRQLRSELAHAESRR
ncbi:MAG: cobalamin B12-binding domain-containing protein [Gemmatimonadales bacterium]|nr:cobalamin B12-binding domain-containing protein [Gemmatimonadales bacterium]